MGGIALRSGDGALVAHVRPDAGMSVTSLRHGGVELLGSEEGIADPVLRAAMTGIPFLHPWANRLSRGEYACAGRVGRVPAGTDFVPRDGTGLAIHGLRPLPGAWSTDPGGDRVRARMEFGLDGARGEAFPFPHRVELDLVAGPGELAIETRITPTGDVPVPIAFGFHPYFRLPDVARADWRLELPRLRRIETDARGLPTGDSVLVPARSERLGGSQLDDAYADVPPGARLVLSGGGREIAVCLDEGFGFAQVYAPSASDVVCLEPMTAPLDALVTGTAATVAPGATYRSRFRVAVSAAH